MKRRTVKWWAAILPSGSLGCDPSFPCKINRINIMSTRSSRACARYCTAFAVALMLLVCPEAQSGGYLALIGPAPFRFQSPPPEENNAILPPLSDNGNDTVSKQSGSNPFFSPIVVQASETTRVGPALSGYLSPYCLTTADNANWQDVMTYEGGHSSETTSAASPAANDLLVVTPQMLVNYFKPGKTTNGPSASVLVPMGMNPPASSTPRPASQATYQSP